MPGYIIHLAIGKVYAQNNKISDLVSFEKGIIAPDMAKDKAKSHYGPYTSKPGLDRYIQNNKNINSYQEGYFLHLVTDHLFYNKFLKDWNPVIYEDYDKLNNRIMHKYGIVMPEEIQDTVKFKQGELSFLKEEELYQFINSVGKLNIREIISQKEIDKESPISNTFELYME